MCKLKELAQRISTFNDIEIKNNNCIKDCRVFCWLHSLDYSISKQLYSVQLQKGFLKCEIKNRYTSESFLKLIGCDDNNGVEIYPNLFNPICDEDMDYWVIQIQRRLSDFDASDIYYQYINSASWKEKSLKFKEKYDGVCSLCNTWVGIENLETHHKQYPKDFKVDKEDNWIAICKVCHRKIHGVI